MNDLQLVSVIMPNYNYAKYLRQSINSVLTQTHPYIELIIIDDASTDCSLEIIQQYVNQYNNVKLISNKTNKGVSACRNLGIEVSNGNYLCFIDPDDYWEEDKLALQLKLMQEQEFNLCFTDIQIIDAYGNMGKIRKHFYKTYSYNSLLKRNFIPHSTLIVKKELLDNIRYKEIPVNYLQKSIMQVLNIRRIIHEDYELLLTIFKNKQVKPIHIAKPLVKYRVHTYSYSGSYLKKLFSLYCIYKNTQGFNTLQSFFYTIRIAFFASLKNIS